MCETRESAFFSQLLEEGLYYLRSDLNKEYNYAEGQHGSSISMLFWFI